MQNKLDVARVRTLKLRTQSFALGTQNVRTGKGFEWKYIGCIFNTCAYSINLLSCPQSVDIDRCTNTYLITYLTFCHNFGIDKRYVKLTLCILKHIALLVHYSSSTQQKARAVIEWHLLRKVFNLLTDQNACSGAFARVAWRNFRHKRKALGSRRK